MQSLDNRGGIYIEYRIGFWGKYTIREKRGFK